MCYQCCEWQYKEQHKHRRAAAGDGEAGEAAREADGEAQASRVGGEAEASHVGAEAEASHVVGAQCNRRMGRHGS